MTLIMAQWVCGQAALSPWGFARPKRARRRFLECSFKSRGVNHELRPNAMEGGQSPEDYMLGIVREQSFDIRPRVDAVSAATPYVGQKLFLDRLLGLTSTDHH